MEQSTTNDVDSLVERVWEMLREVARARSGRRR